MDIRIQLLKHKGLLWPAETFNHKNIARPDMRLSFGIHDIDSYLPSGGLAPAATHEFIMKPAREGIPAFPPCTLPLLLAERNFSRHINHHTAQAPLLVFIGKQCWPSIYVLYSLFHHHQALLPDIFYSSMLFLDPPETKLHWCIEKSIRSPAVSTIVSVLEPCPLALTKRFALLSKHHGTSVLFIRPPAALGSRGFFFSRWTLEHLAAFSSGPAWQLQLQSIQGARPTQRAWNLYLHCKEYYGKDTTQKPSLSLMTI